MLHDQGHGAGGAAEVEGGGDVRMVRRECRPQLVGQQRPLPPRRILGLLSRSLARRTGPPSRSGGRTLPAHPGAWVQVRPIVQSGIGWGNGPQLAARCNAGGSVVGGRLAAVGCESGDYGSGHKSLSDARFPPSESCRLVILATGRPCDWRAGFRLKDHSRLVTCQQSVRGATRPVREGTHRAVVGRYGDLLDGEGPAASAASGSVRDGDGAIHDTATSASKALDAAQGRQRGRARRFVAGPREQRGRRTATEEERAQRGGGEAGNAVHCAGISRFM